MEIPFQEGDALLIVDVQNDFTSGGALAVPQGDEVVPVLNEAIRLAKKAGVPIIASRDWHPPDHMSFEDQGGPWPIHCVQNTKGAQFHPALELPPDAHIVDAGVTPHAEGYSSFEDTGLERWLRDHDIKRLWVGGLALDYCVGASSLDARKAGLGVELMLPATRAIAEDSKREMMEKLKEAGVDFVEQ